MVSFQCHNCGDVVKKPKLDQHSSRCHGGFDCIDCSTTFNTPAEYKMHTSCISEAEKYQKSLYKGPTTIQGRDGRQNGGGYKDRGGYQQNGMGRGGYNGSSGRGGRPQWGYQQRSRATGANDTPLGTPTRMSPVTKAVETDDEKAPKPGKIEPVSAPAPTAVTVDTVKETASKTEKETKEKTKKDKKRKGEDEGARVNGEPAKKKVKVEEKHVESVPEPSSSLREKKSEKKDKKEKKGKEKVAKEPGVKEAEGKTKKEKKEKKEKDAKETETNEEIKMIAKSEKKDKKKKKDRQKELTGDQGQEMAEAVVIKKEKKAKKEKKTSAEETIT